MTTPTTPQNSEDRRVKRALKYVSDYWMPINPKLLQKIQLGIQDGAYEKNVNALLGDLRQDVSLFCHCLRKLGSLLEQRDEVALDMGHALSILEKPDLIDLFSVSPAQLSSHSLKGGNGLQMARFRETLLSASAAEALAEKCDLSPSHSYSVAVVRQLGLTLIAWNYPGTYEQAIVAMQGGEDLDSAIATRLGFSPATLASRLLSSWGFSAQTERAANLFDEVSDDELYTHTVGRSVSDLCKLAEALSRANEPSVYPRNTAGWDDARSAIEAMIGRDGITEILERYQEVCEGYVTYVPELFQVGVLVPLTDQSDEERAEQESTGSYNPFLLECSEEVRNAVAQFRDKMRQEYDRRAVLRYFVDNTLPAFGFDAACVFTLDPGLMLLLPQLHVGRPQARTIRSVDYSLALADGDVVALAFRTNDPVVEYKQVASGEIVSVMAGVLGRGNRVGVFYTECPQFAMNEYQDQRVIHFLAARHVLHECLGLE